MIQDYEWEFYGDDDDDDFVEENYLNDEQETNTIDNLTWKYYYNSSSYSDIE